MELLYGSKVRCADYEFRDKPLVLSTWYIYKYGIMIIFNKYGTTSRTDLSIFAKCGMLDYQLVNHGRHLSVIISFPYFYGFILFYSLFIYLFFGHLHSSNYPCYEKRAQFPVIFLTNTWENQDLNI